MSYGFLRELRDLSVVVVHPLDEDGQALTEHLRRIGCGPNLIWPIPERLPEKMDILIVSIGEEMRREMASMLRALPKPGPTIVAIVNYENPASLQALLESGAMAAIGRPIRPFGLLSNLAIARYNWHQITTTARDARRYKRKVMGEQVVVRAKTILMVQMGVSEDDAHRELRRRAMEERVPIEALAKQIVEEFGVDPVKDGGR